ncbi:MAG: tetratricopeptide repeat protein, partial [Calditrichaeota bacterium]
MSLYFIYIRIFFQTIGECKMPTLFSINYIYFVISLYSAVLLFPVNSLIAQSKRTDPNEVNLLVVKDTAMAAVYFDKAQTLAQSAKFDSSNFYYRQALDIYSKLSEKPGQEVWEQLTRCHSNIGNNLWKLGKYRDAEKSLSNALEIGLKNLGNDHSEIARCYTRMAIVHTIEGDYDRAVENIEKSLAISVAKYPEIAAKNYNNIGIIQVEKGDYDKALEYYQKALSIRMPLLGEDHPDIGRTYSNIGNVYWYKGDYDKALEYHKKDLSIETKAFGTEHLEVATVYHNIGMIYATKGDHNQALEFWGKTLAIRLQALGKDHPLTASTYFNISLAYMEMEQFTEAIENGEKSLTIRTRIFGENSPDVAQSCHLLGNIFFENGQPVKALNYLERALTIRLEKLGDFHPDVALSYYLLGEVYAAQNEYQTALDYCQKSVIASVAGFDDKSYYHNPPLEGINHKTTLLKNLKLKAKIFALVARNTGSEDLEMALATYMLAAELIDKIRSGYKAEGSKLFLRETESELYENAIQTALMLYQNSGDEHYKHQAFTLVEKGKSAVLSAGLAEAHARQFAHLPAHLLEKEQQLRIELAFYETQLEKEKFNNPRPDSTKISELENRLFDLKSERDRLIEDFEKNYPAYHELKYQSQSASIQELQNYLPENTVLLEYFVGKRIIHIFAVSRNEFEVISAEITDIFPSLIADFYGSAVKAKTQGYLAAAGELSGLLI